MSYTFIYTRSISRTYNKEMSLCLPVADSNACNVCWFYYSISDINGYSKRRQGDVFHLDLCHVFLHRRKLYPFCYCSCQVRINIFRIPCKKSSLCIQYFVSLRYCLVQVTAFVCCLLLLLFFFCCFSVFCLFVCFCSFL